MGRHAPNDAEVEGLVHWLQAASGAAFEKHKFGRRFEVISRKLDRLVACWP